MLWIWTIQDGPLQHRVRSQVILVTTTVNFFFGGAMDVLQPYIDEGKLVVPSGQMTEFDAGCYC